MFADLPPHALGLPATPPPPWVLAHRLRRGKRRMHPHLAEHSLQTVSLPQQTPMLQAVAPPRRPQGCAASAPWIPAALILYAASSGCGHIEQHSAGASGCKHHAVSPAKAQRVPWPATTLQAGTVVVGASRKERRHRSAMGICAAVPHDASTLCHQPGSWPCLGALTA